MKKSEEILHLLLKNSNDIIILVNEKGEQFYISDVVTDITGYSVEELKGSILDVIHPDDKALIAQHWDRVIANNTKSDTIQYRHKHKEKGYVWFEVVAQNYLDNPAINAVIANVRDITDRKQNETLLKEMVTTIKMYDGNTTAVVTNNGTLSGVETSDIGNVNFTVLANYDDAQVGVSKTITVVYSINGTAASNYNAPVSYQINGTTIYSTDPPTLVLTTNSGCQGDMVDVNYTILTGSPVEYQIMFNQAALNAGFVNVSFTALPSANISDIIQFMAPAGVLDGNYQAEVIFRNMYGVESQIYPINFIINLSSDYIIPKFTDVVLCNNVDNRFVSFQWYKNGVLIPGATNQFYNDPNGLNGAYSLTVVTTSGETLNSCEKTLIVALSQQPLVNVFPNPVASSQNFMVEIDNLSNIDLKGAVMILYNINGEVVYTSSYVGFQNRINLSANGEYHGVIKTLDGKTLSYKVVIIK